MQMHMIDTLSTTVEEVHEHICDTAVELAIGYVGADRAIPLKWRGPVFRNGAPYNDGRLVLDIEQEYQSAPENIKVRYRKAAIRGVQSALVLHQDLVGGMILGEMKAGRNYFDRWGHAPTRLF